MVEGRVVVDEVVRGRLVVDDDVVVGGRRVVDAVRGREEVVGRRVVDEDVVGGRDEVEDVVGRLVVDTIVMRGCVVVVEGRVVLDEVV